MEPNLSQALHLLNGSTVENKIKAGGLIKKRLAEKKEPIAVAEELYLRTLTRKPTEDESAALRKLLRSARSRRARSTRSASRRADGCSTAGG